MNFKIGDKVEDWAGDIGTVVKVRDRGECLDIQYDSPNIAGGNVVTRMKVIDEGACGCNFTVIEREEEYKEHYLNESMITKKTSNKIIELFTDKELLKELKRRMK